MTSITAQKSVKHVQDSESPTSSPLAGPGPGGHKPSFKGTKLARRARSFKDDFLGKISQIRSPTTTTNSNNSNLQQSIMGRSNSPKSSTTGRSTTKSTEILENSPINYSKYLNNNHNCNNRGPLDELDDLWKQTEVALKHFRDVVTKQKLEMLPGNGTIVLDTVWMINLAVKSSVINDTNSSTILSATNHMYQSVARLIKLCDDALIDDKSAELNIDNVNEIIIQVQNAVSDLIKLAQEKIAQQQQSFNHNINNKTTPRTTFNNNNNNNNNNSNNISNNNTNLEVSTQRNSLPDIPLTPRERQILEQTTCTPNIVRGSHSSESILRDPSPPPPPKPPLPDGVFFSLNHSDPNLTPPPLPPKKRNYRLHHHLTDGCYSTDTSPITSSLERVSMRSKSPEGSLSLLSVSAGSTDSILNHSKADEEIRALMDQGFEEENFENRTSDIFGVNSSHLSWEESSLNSNISNQLVDYHRLSNTDSGILSSSSSQSYRSSSYSKRSSQQSSISTSVTTTQQLQQQQQHYTSSSSSTTTKQESLKIEKTDDLLIKNLNQKTSSSSSSSSSSSLISTIVNLPIKDEPDFINLDDDDDGDDIDNIKDITPPAIPQKTRQRPERQPSPYDNVPDSNLGGELLVTCQMHQSHQNLSNTIQDNTKPPPLPPKKKHMFQSVAYSVMAYMEMFGNCSHTNEQEFMRHSVHMVQTQWSTTSTTTTLPQTSTPNLTTTQSCSFSHISSHNSRSSHSVTMINLPTTDQRIPSPIRSPNLTNQQTPPALPPKQRHRKQSPPPPPPLPPPLPQTPISNETKSPIKILPDLLEHTAINTTTTTPITTTTTTTTTKINDINRGKTAISQDPCDIDLMEELNVEQWLILKKPDEDGPDIRGGPIDALIIQATKATKNGVFIYQEAFLTTYRTFITPCELINKLIRRYNHFYYQPDKKPRSREAFALIVRVVSDLTTSDLDEELQRKLMNFVQQLISCGELTLAKALRVKHLERHEAKQLNLKLTNIVTSITLNARHFTLLDFKSEQIAEQMTLLDSDLFMKIEIPEVLIWAQEQNEERSPNLTRFTEHFNKMSYWARTKILTAEMKDIREKYFLKFIKIMKHLRKINNFNSYLALLSALDSAPIRRLEWQKHVQEGLKEYCALIDSSSSFRAYRQALAETQPPCIPYIGLVLQDLTFVHIGNSNLLPDGTINFSKRWQQFNIVENMKKFKKGTYMFKKNERIIQFFQNFDDFIGEDAMWQLSESIKPRGSKKPT